MQARAQPPARSAEPPMVPRALLRAVGALVLLCLALVSAARVIGMDPVAAPPPSEPAEIRRLVIAPAGQGVVVTDADTGEVILHAEDEGGGFVGGVQRAVSRVRTNRRAPALAPVELIRWRDGRLSLHDPASGWRVELQGFGDANHRAFAALLRGVQTEGERP